MRIVAVLSCVLVMSIAGFVHGDETGKSHRSLRVAPAAANRSLPADGGWGEFSKSPESAWQPVTNGVRDEFRSTNSYPNMRDVIGAFGDSMIGLNSYFHRSDLQATNELIDYDDWDRGAIPLYAAPLEVGRQASQTPTRLNP